MIRSGSNTYIWIMRKVLIAYTTLCLSSIALHGSYSFAQEFFETSDQFFSTYVDEKGLVDYKQLKKQSGDLEALIEMIENTDLTVMSDEQMKAFLINAYNILVIKQVVDSYPIKNPVDVKGFFDGISHNVGGDKLNLNDVEKGVLFRQFPDPRLHFILVCAALDCPKLANYAYLPDHLDQQIKDRTKFILNDKDFIREKENGVEVSMIFSWYIKDFGDSSESILKYINSYRYSATALKSTISFYEYDWTLNSQ